MSPIDYIQLGYIGYKNMEDESYSLYPVRLGYTNMEDESYRLNPVRLG